LQGDLESAEKQYRAAITIQNKKADYYAALGRVLRKKDDSMPEAITVLNRAIELDPHNDQAEFELALAYRSQGRLEKAKHLLEDLTAREPDIVDAHQVLGMIYYQLHSPNDGARQIATARELERNALQRAARMPSSNISESGGAVAYQ
jgi:tetratricopeptide (TPR) repeat protein